MVIVQEGRTLILPFEDLFVVVGLLLFIVTIVALWKTVPGLLALFAEMGKLKSSCKVLKRRRISRLALTSAMVSKETADPTNNPIQHDSSKRECMNAALPPEIVGHVLQHLRTKQHRRGASQVCGMWYLILAQLELQRRRHTKHCRRPSKTSARTGKSACKGRKLVETVIQPSGIPLAAFLLRLCKQHTKGLIIKDAGRMTFADYKLISAFGNDLMDLTIQNCHNLDTRTLVGLLDGCTSLRSLHLTVTSGLDDEAASEIARKCPHLQELRLTGCYGISPLGVLSVLHGCSELEKLHVNAMRYMDVEGSAMLAVPIVPEGPAWNLRVLGLVSSRFVTDELLGAMAPRLRNLQQLDISNCEHVTDAGVGMLIQECQGRLKDLKVKGSAVSDVTLHKLAGGATVMRLLSIANCQGVTDNGIQAITNAGKMPSLRHLCISSCRGVTDSGLEYFATRQRNMPGFDILDLQQCPNISATGPKAKLRERMVVIS